MLSVEWPSSGADRSAASAAARQLSLLQTALSPPRMLSAVRGGGSCVLDLAWVGCGRLDLTYRGHDGPLCWDVCAGALLVEEGGGALTGPTGGPFNLMSGTHRRGICRIAARLADGCWRHRAIYRSRHTAAAGRIRRVCWPAEWRHGPQ